MQYAYCILFWVLGNEFYAGELSVLPKHVAWIDKTD